VIEPLIGWHVPCIGDCARSAMLEDLADRVARLDELLVTPPPSLDGFDPQMRPPGRP